MAKRKDKVIVSGSSGYLGSYIADCLEDEGYEVILFDKTPSKFKTPKQTEIIGDISSISDIEAASRGCKYFFHFAAQADINMSGTEARSTIENNILGTLNVLEACSKNNIERFLFASSIYVYSDLGSFYRVSKQACEKMIQEYQNQYGLDFTILRYGSLYGPRANKFNSIFLMLSDAIKKNKIIRKGNGEEIREYIHVKDAASMTVASIADKYKNKSLVITGNQQIKIKDLLKMIQEIMHKNIKIEFTNEEDFEHYRITPYSYKSESAQRMVPESFSDLGQGLLDTIYAIEDEIEENRNIETISLRSKKK
jgi:UDP-glucose 4-epimerase